MERKIFIDLTVVRNPHSDVLLLPLRCTRSLDAALPLVEEVPHHPPGHLTSSYCSQKLIHETFSWSSLWWFSSMQCSQYSSSVTSLWLPGLFPILFSSPKILDHLHFSLMFCGTGLQYFILFSAFYKKTYRFWDIACNFVCPFLKWPFIQRKPKSTSANGEKTPTISENGTKKAPAVCKEEEKKLSDTEDLLEDLGRATDKVIEWQKILMMLGANNFSSTAITFRTGKEKQRLDLLIFLKQVPLCRFLATHWIVFIPGPEGLSQGGWACQVSRFSLEPSFN